MSYLVDRYKQQIINTHANHFNRDNLRNMLNQLEALVKKDKEEFYVCPNHTKTGGYEECCYCGGWEEGEAPRLCTEAIK